LTRLRTAAQTALSVGAVLLLEWLFARTVRPLMIPGGTPAADAANQAVEAMAMMAGAMVVMVSTFAGPMFSTLGTGLLGLFLLPASMVAGIAVALALGSFKFLSLVTMVVILGGTGFLRRFGAWGFVIGQGLFMGNFLGFFLGRITDLGGLGWIAVELSIGAAVALAAQALLFAPTRRSAVKRLRASFVSRCDGVAGTSIDMLDNGGTPRWRKRQHQAVLRLNEAALMLDAELASEPHLPAGITAGGLHRTIFSAELSLANAARFARVVAAGDVGHAPGWAVARLRAVMVAVRERSPRRIEAAATALGAWLDDPERREDLGPELLTVLQRFVASAAAYAGALTVLQRYGYRGTRRGWFGSGGAPTSVRAATATEPSADTAPFEASVSLASGWLPGSSAVSATASKEKTAQHLAMRMDPSVRVGIQITVAAAVSVMLGAFISPDRFYWAVMATFVTFMGANNAAEHVRKGAFRVIGTVVGILLGAVLAHLVGDRVHLSIAVILVTLFIGIYLMRVSYAFFATAITVLVAQLYVQLGEFSAQLLQLRLLETVVGAAVAVLTVLLVFPLRTGRVVRIATREFVDALGALVLPALTRLRDPDSELALRSAARDLDAAFQALEAATAPGRARLRVPGALGGVKQQWWFAANAAHSYARDLVMDTTRPEKLPGEAYAALHTAGEQLVASAAELSRGLTEHGSKRIYTRSASQFERVAASLEDHRRLTARQLAFRDLQLLDGALATLAESAGLRIVSERESADRPADNDAASE